MILSINMSFIIVKYQKRIEKELTEKFEEINEELIDLTAKIFNKKKEEIIVDFECFGTYDGQRDILVRAETSRPRIDSLKDWSNEISNVFKKYLGDKNLKIGIKTYVLDFFWEEVN